MTKQATIEQGFLGYIIALAMLLQAGDITAQEVQKSERKMLSGASAISETYDDWLVNCEAGENGAACGMLHVLSERNGQRIVTFSVSPIETNDSHEGSFILPFGLELPSGVTIALGDAAPSPAINFKTCLPTGCIVPLTWTAEQYNALLAAKTLLVRAKMVNGQPFELALSLKGLSAAAKRAGEILSR